MGRDRSRKGTQFRGVFLGVCLLLACFIVVPAGSFSTASVDRSSTLDVVSDAEASHNLDIAQSVTVGQTSRLVTVTNGLGDEVTVTVRLNPDSAEKGDLVVENTTVGNETSFSLQSNEAQRIDIAVTSDETLDGDRVYFSVNATGPEMTVKSSNRYTTINS